MQQVLGCAVQHYCIVEDRDGPGDRLIAATRDLLDHPPTEVAFWSGAGISGDAPTQGPLGVALTDRAIAGAFVEDQLLDPLRLAYSRLGLERDRPRLESVLDAAASEHGVEVLEDLLSDLRAAQPNGNHDFFAAHTCDGGFHATANFDTCIERAGGAARKIIHLHGSFNDDGGVAALGARLSRIERGFDADMKARLDGLLLSAKVLVVVGYSGLDFFDVDPYLRDAASRGLFQGRRIVWINHVHAGWAVTKGEAVARKQLRLLADHGGASIWQIDAPTRSVLNLLAESWRYPVIPAPPPWAERHPRPLHLPAEAKSRATTRFLVTVGLHDVVRRRVKAGSLNAEGHAWAATAAWAGGRYRDAASHWASAQPGDDPADRASRAERAAACMWLRGQLVKARRLLRDTIADAIANGLDNEQILVLAETLGRVLVHMRRLPDTRILVTQRWIDFVQETLRRHESVSGQPLGVHLQVRVASVRAALMSGTDDPAASDEPTAERRFDEFEALNAMLNYQHAALRARADAGGSDAPGRWEYVRHRDRFLALGAYGDAARVPLLPGGASAFSLRDIIKTFGYCDYTGYHKVRLIAMVMLANLHGRRSS